MSDPSFKEKMALLDAMSFYSIDPDSETYSTDSVEAAKLRREMVADYERLRAENAALREASARQWLALTAEVAALREAAGKVANTVVLSDKCTCHEAYAGRGLTDPNCDFHNDDDDEVRAAMSDLRALLATDSASGVEK